MTEAFRSKLQAKLADYRVWSARRKLTGCRLVHYCGIDLAGSQDLPLAEAEARISGLICEGFRVDWKEHEGRLFLRVWEFGGPEPDWPKVLAEQPLADAAQGLRRVEG